MRRRSSEQSFSARLSLARLLLVDNADLIFDRGDEFVGGDVRLPANLTALDAFDS